MGLGLGISSHLNLGLSDGPLIYCILSLFYSWLLKDITNLQINLINFPHKVKN